MEFRGREPRALSDSANSELREAIAARFDLDPARIICGTGSDEVLHMAAGAFAGPGDEIIYSRFGFTVYPIATRRVGATPVVAPDKDYATDVDAILSLVDREDAGSSSSPIRTIRPAPSRRAAEIARLPCGSARPCATRHRPGL